MFINHIYRHAQENPEHLAVVNSGQEITYRRFAATIEAVRNHLMAARLPESAVIAIITSNLYHDAVLLLALRSLGLTTVAGTSWQAIESLALRDVRALVCFSDKAEAKADFTTARPDCPVVEVPRGIMTPASPASPPPPLPGGVFGDHILYTSGTTGTYKKLRFCGESIEANIEHRSLAKTGHFEADDVYYNHSFGPWTAAGHIRPLNCWYRGATLIFEQRQDWAEHFFDYPVTKTFFVPALLDQVSKRVGQTRQDGSRLSILIAGGFLDAELARKVIDQFGCELLISYGGTEFMPCLESIFRSDEDVVWLTPAAGTEFEIVDEDDRPVARGVEGIMRVRCVVGDPSEYVDDAATTAKHFRDGYFYPGDMAVEREDGKVRILGRVDDVLNLAGQKIPVQPFEDLARKTLGVKNLCVFNQQDDSGKDALVIVVEGAALPERARLEALARGIKDVPQVRFSLISQFPRGDNGMMKINRRKVLELVRASWSEQARQAQDTPQAAPESASS